MKMSTPGICNLYIHDKNSVRMFSQENSMDPGPVPDIMQGLSLVEQQLNFTDFTCRTSPHVKALGNCLKWTLC